MNKTYNYQCTMYQCLMVRKNTLFLLFTYNKILFKWKERMECLEVLRCIIFPNKYTTVLWWTFNKFVCQNMCTCWFVRDSFVIIVVWAITLDLKKSLTSFFGTFTLYYLHNPLYHKIHKYDGHLLSCFHGVWFSWEKYNKLMK